MASASNFATIVRDADWLVHRYDEASDTFRFVRAPRSVHQKATFLTDEFLSEADRPVVIPRAEAVGLAPPSGPLHFIFHSAYCCSTLLARAFDRPGASMGLKEPNVLNDVSGWKRRGAEPRQVAMVLDHSLRLLGRPFSRGETIVIKPSNVVNVLAPAMLAMRPSARALLLHAPLETYLSSIIRKGMWGRLWVRELLTKQLQDRLLNYGFSAEDYLRQTDLQVAAIGWLAQHALFKRLIERFGPDRVRVLDSETLVEKPAAAMNQLARLFGLDWPEDVVRAIVAGEAFTRHSKLGESFGTPQRQSEQRATSLQDIEEVRMVSRWAAEVAARQGQTMEVGPALLDA